ncbi:hypothetical protein HOC01_02055 [archaeon]|jgi:hypothetical protein|nr:hypothetical protein [archaeon]MBT6697896.1 hypothetical protein [archaeon]
MTEKTPYQFAAAGLGTVAVSYFELDQRASKLGATPQIMQDYAVSLTRDSFAAVRGLTGTNTNGFLKGITRRNGPLSKALSDGKNTADGLGSKLREYIGSHEVALSTYLIAVNEAESDPEVQKKLDPHIEQLTRIATRREVYVAAVLTHLGNPRETDESMLNNLGLEHLLR